MNNDYGNLELHKVLLGALCDFDKMCRKYRLKYCLHGGSCLGAVRHKGFIPWDDDVDIAMLREDYDKLMKIDPSEWGEKYTVRTYKNDTKLLTNVMKIRINEVSFEGEAAFLDVFPMSDVPNSKFLQNIQNNLAILVNNVICTKAGEVIPTSRKAKLVLLPLSKLSKKTLSNILESIIVHFPHGKSKYVNIVATANYNGNTGYAWDLIPKEYFENVIPTEFEGQEFYITEYWDEYLKSHYGNYMEFPPVEKRINKHSIQIKKSEGDS